VADLKKSVQEPSARDAPRAEADAPRVRLSNARPEIVSADEQFRFAVRAMFQLDAASYDQGDPPVPDNRNAGASASEGPAARDLNSGTNFRRARLGVEGTAFRDWNYALTAEFGGSGSEAPILQQAWLDYAGWKPFGAENSVRLRIGAYTWPTGLEDATSNTDAVFIERAAIADVVRSSAGGDGRVGAGILTHGSRWNASAALTGAVVGESGTFDEQTAFVGRLAGQLLRSRDAGLHVGANTQKIFQFADTTAPGTDGPQVVRLRERPELRVDGTRLVDTGNLSADNMLTYGVELGAQWRSFLATSEIYWIDVDRPDVVLDPDFGGWYLQGSLALTGEQRRWNPASGGFGGIRPAHVFNPAANSWGAFELAARYSVLDLNFNEGVLGAPLPLDGVRGGRQEIITLGLNWFPNSVIRFLLDYYFVDVDRLNPGVFVTTPPDGAQIGQDYQAVALRSQMAF
jgi:phosphate-selective porin OprO/OprP